MKKFIQIFPFCIAPFVGYNQVVGSYLTSEVRNEIRRIWALDTCGEKGKRDSLVRSTLKRTTFIGLKRTDIEDIFGKPEHITNSDGRTIYSYVLWGTVDSQTHSCKCGTLYTASELVVGISVKDELVDYFKIEEE